MLDSVFDDIKKIYEGGNTILHRAILSYGSEFNEGDVEELLDAGAETNALNDDSLSPLHLAAQRGLSVVVKLLCSKGADVNLQDKEGRSPLHYACRAYREDPHGDIKFEDQIKFLIHAGAVALEDGVGGLPDPGPQADFRTARLLDEAVTKGEAARKEQRRARQERAAAAFSTKVGDYQAGCSAAMVGVMDSGSHEGYKIMK